MALTKSTKQETKKLNFYTIQRIDFAQIERSHALIDGLFKPIDHKVERPFFHVRHHLTTKHGKSLTHEWQGIQLDITDQQVLLAILRIISEKSRQLSESEIDSESLTALTSNFNFSEASMAMLVANTSLTEICTVAGMKDSGQNIEAVYQSLNRMQSTKCRVYLQQSENATNRIENSFSMISHWGMKAGNAYVGINPFLSKAISGDLHVTHLDMTHIRSIRGAIGKKLFLWLSAWASYDRTQTIGLDRLIGHVWGDSAKDNATLRKRRMKLRAALESVAKLEGWSIKPTESDNAIFSVRKPKYI